MSAQGEGKVRELLRGLAVSIPRSEPGYPHEMRIFLAGGSGAIGRQLIPLLIADGHAVFATTRRPDRLSAIAALGAEPLVLDALDRDAVHSTLAGLKPDAIIHQLTDLAGGVGPGNAALRVHGTRNLVDAAKAVGVDRMVAQSIAWVVEPGSSPANESTPLDPDTTEPRAGTVAGVRALETAVLELPYGVVLRYGQLYGPGTWYARNGRYGQDALAGILPATPAIATFVHVTDAARAAVAALAWPPGTVNILDDTPAPGTDWVPVFAAVLDAPPPSSEPGPATGRLISNAKMHTLGFSLTYPSWRTGFQTL
jgi:nucleoside-diphosphate-sugar epimerase